MRQANFSDFSNELTQMFVSEENDSSNEIRRLLMKLGYVSRNTGHLCDGICNWGPVARGHLIDSWKRNERDHDRLKKHLKKSFLRQTHT